MRIKTYQADAFTAQAFSGNPAAVCLPEKELETGLMHAIASENNLPMTAFLTEKGTNEKGVDFSLRWFNSAGEKDFCGHATLAGSHVLFEAGRVAADRILHFHTRAGLLSARKKEAWIEMDLPAFTHEKAAPDQISKNMLKALGQDPVSAAISEGWYLIELPNDEAVKNTRPDFRLLLKEPPVVITARGKGKYDFVSRFFAPAHGENEDAVTGSAHCRLAPYWSEKLGKNKFFAFQASDRGGELQLRLEENRLKLGGQAVIVMEGNLHL